MPFRPLTLIAIVAGLASPALAELSLRSQAAGLEIVAIDNLPAAPQDQGDTDFCSHLFVETVSTPGGQDAAAKGWHVTAELAFGDLTAVSFVGSAEPATSGTCALQDGNVGLYSGTQLVALVYGTQPDQLLIGRIRPFGDGLRILSGDVLPGTVADLVRLGDEIQAVDPAGQEPVCNGAGVVPDIEGLPIDAARKALIGAGWEPVPGDPARQGLGQAQDIAAAGVPEVDDCSGAGLAFCAYRYAGAAGALSVITAGEVTETGGLPQVSSYGVDCR